MPHGFIHKPASTTISRRSLLLGAAAFGALALTGGCHSDHTATPGTTTLFTNGTIYRDAWRTATNLLVRDGVVLGWDVDPDDYPLANVIDLAGAALYPGFIDSHVHLESNVFFRLGTSLADAQDAPSITTAIATDLRAHPERTFVLGVGFTLRDYDQWSLADLAALDAATGERPAFLADNLGHNAIINSAMIQLAGITPATPAPPGGRIGIQDGQLTGMLRESAMMLASQTLISLFDDQDIKAALLSAAQRWAAMGYTGCVDLMGATGIRFMKPEAFWELEQEDKLPLRTHYCYTIFNLSDVDAAVRYRGKDTPLTHFVGCKLFVDGAFAAGQAWTSWPHLQGDYGLPQVFTDDRGGPELNINRIVARVEAHGMNIHYHTQGDMAISAVLDALDQVVARNGRVRGIHTLIHLAFPTDEQIERIKQFDGHVVTTTQPGFWEVEADTVFYYGERADLAYPVKRLIDRGFSVGMSTDWSVSPARYAPATAVIGVAATGGGHPDKHPPIPVREMIHGFTIGSAATTGRIDIGKLEVGYKADLVIFDQDLNALAPGDFTKDHPKVLATYVNGIQAFAGA
ncbi:MAG: amidohydrolase family protein [Chromatiaceae bacterium]|nr:amidohydrolase family protein [Chromatiaceae bacterium]